MKQTNDTNLAKKVDAYIQDLFVSDAKSLDFILEESKRNNLPEIHISPTEGKLLYFLAKLSRAEKILEIGTLGGYSAIWLARALPEDGHLLTLEIDSSYAEIARKNIEKAGVESSVEVRAGTALDLLPEVLKNNEGPFDLIFIDADKESYPEYLEWAIKLSHSGSLILSDNLLRNGNVLEEKPKKEYYKTLAQYNNMLATDKRIESFIIPNLIPSIEHDYIDGIGITIVK